MVLDLEAKRLVDIEGLTHLMVKATIVRSEEHCVDEALHIWSIGGRAPLNNGQPHFLSDISHHIKWFSRGTPEIGLEHQINGPSMNLVFVPSFGSNGVEVDPVHDVPVTL